MFAAIRITDPKDDTNILAGWFAEFQKNAPDNY